jgi:hypothetical protein
MAGAALAQQTAAMGPAPLGSTKGEDTGDYNIVNSFETGYRFFTVGGNDDTYRSQVNYGNGIRLLNSYLTINSRDGHGALFDEIVATTRGLGNDPYESATLRVQKNGLYRYDLSWRQNDYFNPGLETDGAAGLHLLDTRYSWQDHDLTLFPQSKVKFFLGYSRGAQSGPAISTVQAFDTSSDNTFPVFADVRRRTNEYRLGNEFTLFGIRVNWMHGWQDYKEDTPLFLSGITQGTNPTDPATLTSFLRAAPNHGTSPYWRAGIFAGYKWIALNGRFSYTGGQRAFALDESAIGTSALAAASRQVVTIGDAQRPVATGNLSVSVFPTSKLTIVNTTSVYNVRTEGDSTYIQYDNSSQTADFLSFQYLGIRTITNESDLNYAWTRWLGVFAGYHYTDRKITSVLFQGMTPYSQTNILDSGIFGFRLRPFQGLTVVFDGEVGRANQPFAAASEKDYTDFSGRVEYKRKSLRLSAATRTYYNVNSTSLSSYSSRSRSYSADASWTLRQWLSFDLSYTKQHVNSLAGIAYFDNLQSIPNQYSLYISNLHTVNAGIQVSPLKRVDLYVAYSRVQDTGDGRDSLLGDGTDASLPALQAAQTFPLTYQAPITRLSIKLSNKVRWNAGYEYYGYRERFYAVDNYRANTGYTSLSWSF